MRIVPFAQPAVIRLAACLNDGPALFLKRSAAAFQDALADVTCLAADFDGTMVRGNTFRHIERLLCEKGMASNERALEDHIAYVSCRSPAPAPAADFRDWLESVGAESDVDRACSEAGLLAQAVINMIRAGVRRPDLEDIAKALSLRPGVEALAAACDRGAVVSAGMEDVSRAFLSGRGPALARLDVIGAVRLAFDEGGRIVGLRHNLWPSPTKGANVRRLCRFWHVERAHVLSIGDSPFDVDLFQESGVAVGILPPYAEDPLAFDDHLARFDGYWNAVDALLVGDSLQPLADLVRAARAA